MMSGLTCNVNGIPLQQRARYGWLVEALRRAIEERRELPDGYAFQMDTAQISTGQLVEWVELERQCCPFFELTPVAHIRYLWWRQQENLEMSWLTGHKAGVVVSSSGTSKALRGNKFSVDLVVGSRV